jgi:hypothetical protein
MAVAEVHSRDHVRQTCRDIAAVKDPAAMSGSTSKDVVADP